MRKIEEYIAGLFDGEGCVSVIKRSSTGCTYHQLDVRITMTALAVLEAIKCTYGGNLQEVKVAAAHYKRSWQLYCQGVVGLNVLRRILPFAIEKQAKIDLAVRFQVARDRGVVFDREKVKQQLSWLKKDTSRVLVWPTAAKIPFA
jgi:hypothetical protein